MNELTYFIFFMFSVNVIEIIIRQIIGIEYNKERNNFKSFYRSIRNMYFLLRAACTELDSARLKEQNCHLTQIEIYKMLGLVSDV